MFPTVLKYDLSVQLSIYLCVRVYSPITMSMFYSLCFVIIVSLLIT